MANIELDGVNKKIKVDSGDLTLDVPGDIVLDADGGDVVVADGGTNILKVTNSSSDVVLQPQVDAKDIIFKQFDGTTVATVEDNGTFNVPANKLAIGGTAVTSTAAELNILDGVTATASELNLLDGGTSVGSSITVADGDGVIMNDGGTMKSVPASALKTYAGGAGLVHLNTTTGTSSVSTVSLNDVFSGYVIYKVLGAVLVDTDSLKIQMQYTKSNGGTVGTASSYRYLYSARDINSSNGIADASNGNNSSGSEFQLAYNMDTDATYSPAYFDLNFYDPGQSFASYQFMDGKITFQSSGGRIVTGVIGGQYRENFNATGLKFSLNASGNYTRYYFNTYGITNSGS